MTAEKPIVTNLNFAALLKTPGRHAVQGASGLFLKALDERRAYWVYRYRSGGKERETSLGSARKMSLAEARIEHGDLTSKVKKHKRDPVAEKRAAKAVAEARADAPTFGEIADAHIAARKAGWRNDQHAAQWSATLGDGYCSAIRALPVDKIDTAAVMRVLEPMWTETPETASRLRGRIEAVLNRARALGHIDPDRANPARWKGHLDQLLPNPKQIGGGRSHHAAMPYTQVPAFMATLSAAPGTAAKALAFVILTAARSGEALGAKWSEIDAATWTVPKERMKANKAHRVPLSDQALAILADVHDAARKPPKPDSFVFPSHFPGQPLRNMAMTQVMRRMKLGHFTVHGFRSAFRNWATEVGKVEYTTAERCLAHAVGSDAALSYDRSDRFDLRRPVMAAWASFVMPTAKATKVVPMRRRERV